MSALVGYLWGKGKGMEGVEIGEVLERAFPGPEGERLMARIPQQWIEQGIEQGATGPVG